MSRRVSTKRTPNIIWNAAERSFLHGDGLDHLGQHLQDKWFEVFAHGFNECFMGPKEYSLSMCFMAAMAETGDL